VTGERPVPRTPIETALARYTQLTREISDAGVRTIGPTLTAAVLEFAAKAVELRAKLDSKWKPEESAEWRRALQDSLDQLEARWRARRGMIVTPPGTEKPS